MLHLNVLLVVSRGGRGGTTQGSFLASGEAPAYDTFVRPDQSGSGGGGPSGGTGRGVGHIGSKKVTIDGRVSADGTDGQGDSGGGAGGSILIEVTDHGPFGGAGLITTIGGRGAGGGGGGAGGRISVIYQHESATYRGHMYVYGGLAGLYYVLTVSNNTMVKRLLDTRHCTCTLSCFHLSLN